MASSTREIRIIGAVACPQCHAPIGKPCASTRDSRPYVHPERRLAWSQQQPKDIRRYSITLAIETDQPVQPTAIGGRIAAGLRADGHRVIGDVRVTADGKSL